MLKKTITWLWVVFISLLGIEGGLRLFPEIIPFSSKWFYWHNYKEIAVALREEGFFTNFHPEIWLIGDSFTRGAEVSPGKSWAEIIEAKNPGKIFNSAIGGASNVEELLLLDILPPPSSVKTAILGIFHNDFEGNAEDVPRLEQEGIKPFAERIYKTTDPAYTPCVKNWTRQFGCYYLYIYTLAMIDNIWQQLQKGNEHEEHLVNLDDYEFDRQAGIYFRRNTKDIQTDPRITLEIIKIIAEKLSRDNISLFVVYFPSREEVHKYASNRGELLSGELKEVGIPFLNLTPILKAAPPPVFLSFDSHMNYQGHKEVAKAIKGFIP